MNVSILIKKEKEFINSNSISIGLHLLTRKRVTPICELVFLSNLIQQTHLMWNVIYADVQHFQCIGHLAPKMTGKCILKRFRNDNLISVSFRTS